MNTAPLPPPYLGRQLDVDHDPHAPVDRVTHVWSRLAILQIGARMLDAARKQEQPVGFVLVAVDPSLSIRSMYGAAMADAVLGEVSRRVRKAMTSTDAIGRYGREELLVVLPGCAQEVIATMADRILRAAKADPVVACGIAVNVTVAIGATIADTSAAQLDEAVIAADVALHRAKLAGCDRVEMRWPTASARLLITS